MSRCFMVAMSDSKMLPVDRKATPEVRREDGRIETEFGDQPPVGEKVEGKELEEISEFRTVLPQVLASTAKNLILLDLGMTLAFPTVVIPALLEAKEGLKFTAEQASWFGSIAFICQPAGSIVSGLLFEPLGRKRAMLLVNLPHIVSWFMLYYATSLTELYVAGVIMGLGVGFMEAPILTYVGEISQPKWRGILTSYAGIFATLGFTYVYFLGTLTDWHTAAAISSAVPMLAILVISQVPESPVWLLSKGRTKEAEASLCWLRGWVSPEHVEKEFKEMIQYNDTTYLSKKRPLEEGINSDVKQAKKSPFKKIVEFFHLKDLFRRQTLQPLILIIVFFLFHHAAGITGTRPFMVEIFKEYGSPLDANVVTVISSAVGFFGNILGMACVQKTGKRMQSMISIVGCATSNILLAVYGFCFMGSGDSPAKWVPITLFITLNFIWSFGIGQIPWMLTSEMFPFRGRGLASGVAAGISYILGFIFTKTYLDLHSTLTISGVFAVYGVFMVVGGILLYYFLPETEGKTLEEIETIVEDKFNQIRRIRTKGNVTS